MVFGSPIASGEGFSGTATAGTQSPEIVGPEIRKLGRRTSRLTRTVSKTLRAAETANRRNSGAELRLVKGFTTCACDVASSAGPSTRPAMRPATCTSCPATTTARLWFLFNEPPLYDRHQIGAATATAGRQPPGLAAQPYHAAAGLDLAAAGQLTAQVESAAEKAAAAGLRALAATRPPGPVYAVAVVVKAVSLPSDLAGILRSHAWMHAAEGVLYRQAVLAGAAGCGWMTHAVEQAVNALGRVAGRPWRRFEKDAARAALALLATVAPGS